ncbi:MAG: hypothetical protein IK081_12660 [Lachnospiraceae bacterium]|nr:hypothetical protein [Lachnospiraceae bacterium]
MNSLVKLEITNQMLNCRNFIRSVKRAALRDNGKIDRKELRTMRKLARVTERYFRELQRLSK